MIIGGAILIVLVIGFVIYKTKPNAEVEKRVYTIQDFPDALKAMDETFRAEKVAYLNGLYQDLGKPGYDDAATWLNIGLYKKALQDFKGTEAAWQKSISLRKEPVIATANLADLYLYYLRDYIKAEEYYKRALSLNPVNFALYEGLANLYRYEMTGKIGEVEAVMNQGAILDSRNTMNYYLYLVDFFDKEGKSSLKKMEYISKVKSLNPSQEVLDSLIDYEK